MSHDKNDDVRSSATAALGRVGSTVGTPDATARLLVLMKDKNAGVRSGAASALGKLGSAAATSEPIASVLALTRDKSDDVRTSAVGALGQLGSTAATPEVLRGLRHLLNDESEEVQFFAGLALGRMATALSSNERSTVVSFWLKRLSTDPFPSVSRSLVCHAAYDALQRLASQHARTPPRAKPSPSKRRPAKSR